MRTLTEDLPCDPEGEGDAGGQEVCVGQREVDDEMAAAYGHLRVLRRVAGGVWGRTGLIICIHKNRRHCPPGRRQDKAGKQFSGSDHKRSYNKK